MATTTHVRTAIMKHHLNSATQRAKEIAFSTFNPPNEAENLIFDSTSPLPEMPLSLDEINTSTHQPAVFNPSPPQPTSFFVLLLLSFTLALFLVFAVYLVFYTFVRGRVLSFEDLAPRYARKLKKKRRPPPLELLAAGGGDVEAQMLRVVAVGGGGGTVRRHGSSGFVSGRGEEGGGEVEGGVATGVDADGEGLTPFTPARARARKYGEGDVEAMGLEGEDELGLGKYFFEDGVGIMRYESTGKAREWKDG